jgi:hypothetical protein
MGIFIFHFFLLFFILFYYLYFEFNAIWYCVNKSYYYDSLVIVKYLFINIFNCLIHHKVQFLKIFLPESPFILLPMLIFIEIFSYIFEPLV